MDPEEIIQFKNPMTNFASTKGSIKGEVVYNCFFAETGQATTNWTGRPNPEGQINRKPNF